MRARTPLLDRETLAAFAHEVGVRITLGSRTGTAARSEGAPAWAR